MRVRNNHQSHVRASSEGYCQSFSKQLVKRQVRSFAVYKRNQFFWSGFVTRLLEFTCKLAEGDRMREQNKDRTIMRLSGVRSIRFLPP